MSVRPSPPVLVCFVVCDSLLFLLFVDFKVSSAKTSVSKTESIHAVLVQMPGNLAVNVDKDNVRFTQRGKPFKSENTAVLP